MPACLPAQCPGPPPCRSLTEEARGGVDPEDAPGVEGRVVHPEGRAVPGAGDRHDRRVRPAITPSRDHPDILDGTAFENPPEVDLTVALVARAVGPVRDDVGLPAADELTVEPELPGAIGGGHIGVEHTDERPSIGHGVRAADGRRGRCAARRNARGDTPAARWKVRTTFDRSRNPTSSAMPEIGCVSWASNRAARRMRHRIRY
jgi:hypothetical protein